MNKYVGIDAISTLITIIKEKFAERYHIHEISDVNGLQRKFDELAIPPDIETSEDVIRKINQLSLAIDDLNDTINTLIPSIGELYITLSDENPSVKFGGTWEQIKDTFLLASGDIYSAGSTGGGQPHNNMPPYLAVFIWKRMA